MEQSAQGEGTHIRPLKKGRVQPVEFGECLKAADRELTNLASILTLLKNNIDDKSIMQRTTISLQHLGELFDTLLEPAKIVTKTESIFVMVPGTASLKTSASLSLQPLQDGIPTLRDESSEVDRTSRVPLETRRYLSAFNTWAVASHFSFHISRVHKKAITRFMVRLKRLQLLQASQQWRAAISAHCHCVINEEDASIDTELNS